MEISGRTGLLGLIGSPVGHSGSPAMYNYSFEILDLDYKYLAFDIPVEKTEDAVNAFRTFNMKVEMLQCLVKEKLQNTWTNYLQLLV